jgi:hypothetical protein
MTLRKSLAFLTAVTLLMMPLGSAFAAPDVHTRVHPHKAATGHPITFSNILDRIDEIPTYAYNKAQDAARKNVGLPSTKNPVYVVKGSHLNTTLFNGASGWIKKAMRMYGHLPLPKKTYLFVYPKRDLSEIQNKAPRLIPTGEDIRTRAAQIYGPGPLCEIGSPMAANTTEIDGVANEFVGVCKSPIAADAQSGVVHEFVHQIQNMQFFVKGKSSQWHRADQMMYYTMPCWPIEGQATFAGFANFSTFAAYKEGRESGQVHPYLLTSDNRNFSLPDPYWTKQSVLKYLNETSVGGTCQTKTSFALSYSLGFLTIEALTAIGGPESHMAMVQRIANGKTLSQAFKLTYGTSWASAKNILAQVVATEIMNVLDPPTEHEYTANPATQPQVFQSQEGCAGYKSSKPHALSAHLQAQVNGEWQDVQTISSGWSRSNTCGAMSNMNYLAHVEAAIDPGTTYRWIFLGEVNIGERDKYGRGVSAPTVA